MRLFSHIAAILALAIFVAQPAAAQSILRDAETEAFLDDISEPLIEAAGLQPNNVDVILINDPSINAFVAGGQTVYINSGLIEAATDANQVQGVFAHELGKQGLYLTPEDIFDALRRVHPSGCRITDRDPSHRDTRSSRPLQPSRVGCAFKTHFRHSRQATLREPPDDAVELDSIVS